MYNVTSKRVILLTALALIIAPFTQLPGAQCAAQETQFRRAKTFYDIWAASCRIDVKGARGTGAFVGVDDDGNPTILTNYHVVEKQNNVKLQFRTNGEQETITGTVTARFYDPSRPYDFALIKADRAGIERVNPPYIALGGADAAPTSNSYILSSGAPKGRFVQAWKGRVIGYYNGRTALFEPGPVPGQSGSAIVSEIDGELWVTGVLTWLIGDEGADDARGGAIPISLLYEAARGKNTSLPSTGTSDPIPPGAVECSAQDEPQEPAPVEVAQPETAYAFEFTRENCEPCNAAVEDVKKIRAAGYPVYPLNVSLSTDAEKRGAALRVIAYPTFIVFNRNGKEQARYIGAGKAQEVIAALDAANVKERAPEPPAPATEEAAPELVLLPPEQITPEVDFRNRPTVQELAGTSFLDDSDARWRNRSGGNDKEQPPEPETRKKEDSNAGILSGIEERFSARVSSIVEKQTGALYNKALDALKRSLKRLFWYTCLIFFIATLGAAFVRKVCNWLFSAMLKGLEKLLTALLDKVKKSE